MDARAVRLGVLMLPALAAAAVGQGTMSFFWTIDDDGNHDGVLQPGETLLATLAAGMNPSPPVGFAGSIFDIAGDAAYRAGTLVAYENLIDSGWDWPEGDNSIRGVECLQLPPLFNPDFVADNPIALYRIGWRPEEYAPGVVGFWSENHQTADVYTDNFGRSVRYDIVIEPGRVVVVPAPGVLAGLGLWGVGAFRRREGR